jgi:hypothetical protein
LGLFIGDGCDSEEECFFGDVVELVVDSSAEEDGLITGESDEHEVVRRMGVCVEQVRCEQLLGLLEDYLLRLILMRGVWTLRPVG